MTNNAILHPWRALKIALRRRLLRADIANSDVPTDVPPSLAPFQVGEVWPMKGTTFKVGKIIGGDFPMIILIPTGRTRGAKLRGLRNMRDIGRAVVKDRRETARALAAVNR